MFTKQQTKPYGQFKMGIQSYSLRHFTLDQALAHTKALGLNYWEAFMLHVPIVDSAATLAEYKQKLNGAKVSLTAYGVVFFGADESDARLILNFAQQMGIGVVTADPAPESLSYLAKLAEEHRVLIAIHNHGPNSRYDKIQDVLKVLESQPKQIGACVDTGHFLRSGENPVDAIRQFGDRVYGVHLKDVKGRTQFTELGKGDLDLVGTLRALKQVRFSECLALEYEEHPENPMRYLEECLAAVRDAVKRVG